MIEFGKTLRTAREMKGLTVSDIAQKTHVMSQTIEGLEKEDFSSIVAPIYGRGFVKLYCEAVGLDPKPLTEAFMELIGKKTPPAPAAPIPKKSPERPAPAPAPAAAPTAAEPPAKSYRQMDFISPPAPAATPAPTSNAASAPNPNGAFANPSRYANPLSIDEVPGPQLPAFNLRLIVLIGATVAVLALLAFGIHALYRVSMNTPTDATEAPSAPTASESATPAPAATAKAPVDRKPLPLKPFYIINDKENEKENN